ncbi:MAG: M23 family metallopeptidase [Clostridia bacterium]|nr:M23 family metallopeptidase [Clostridia bacterium]MDD4375328.1 M23 family metallopeptidase [Clostridia bacterium]
MEGIVAKRCLRNTCIPRYEGLKKLYYTEKSNKNKIDDIYSKGLDNYEKMLKDKKPSKSLIDNIKLKIKMKLWIQAISSMCILITIITCSYLEINYIRNSKAFKFMKKESRKDYSKEEIVKYGKAGMKNMYCGILSIVPDKLEEKVKSIYIEIKKNDKEIKVYEEQTIEEQYNKEISNKLQNGIGVSIEENLNEPNYIEAISSISSEDEHLKYINDNSIEFMVPTKGTITSKYGIREIVFEGIAPYHTGIDIANTKGTKILSSTKGTVIKVSNNKYNGNFVEVQYKDVITRYAHMDSVSVKKGMEITAGKELGKMGETGYATGPHLHFEVVVKGTRIDPQKVLNIN